MFHTANVSVHYAGFYGLGRTDKSLMVDDPLFDANGLLVPGTGTNPRARYPVHFHLVGTEGATPATVRGSAVFDSPGFGYVNHGSYVVMEDNVSFDVFGSHFVAEDGNERGSFRHNIAIKSEGTGKLAKSANRVAVHDLGHSGHGFWMQSRNLEITDNVASGHRGAAFIFFHRSGLRNPSIPSSQLAFPGIAKLSEEIIYNDVPIRKFSGNEAIASELGLQVIKANADQGHDQRNIIEDFRSWHNWEGLNLQYTSKYTLRNLWLIGVPIGYKRWNPGGVVIPGVSDLVFENVTIENYYQGLVVETVFQNEPDITDFVAADLEIINATVDITDQDINLDYVPNDEFHQFFTVSELPVGPLGFTPDPNLKFVAPEILSWRDEESFILSGTKFDSLGDQQYTSKCMAANLGPTCSP